jgi:hypothetical protein
MLLENILFFTPRMDICNRICHYSVPMLETSLRMALLRPKHVGGIS